jgi:hypothetical protein
VLLRLISGAGSARVRRCKRDVFRTVEDLEENLPNLLALVGAEVPYLLTTAERHGRYRVWRLRTAVGLWYMYDL